MSPPGWAEHSEISARNAVKENDGEAGQISETRISVIRARYSLREVAIEEATGAQEATKSGPDDGLRDAELSQFQCLTGQILLGERPLGHLYQPTFPAEESWTMRMPKPVFPAEEGWTVLHLPQKHKATVPESTLRVEMNGLEERADNAKARGLFWKPFSWLGTLRRSSATDAFEGLLHEERGEEEAAEAAVEKQGAGNGDAIAPRGKLEVGTVAVELVKLAAGMFFAHVSWVVIKVTDSALLGHVSTAALAASSVSDLWMSSTDIFLYSGVLGTFVGNSLGAGMPTCTRVQRTHARTHTHTHTHTHRQQKASGHMAAGVVSYRWRIYAAHHGPVVRYWPGSSVSP
jgi:hypothetical protein